MIISAKTYQKCNNTSLWVYKPSTCMYVAASAVVDTQNDYSCSVTFDYSILLQGRICDLICHCTAYVMYVTLLQLHTGQCLSCGLPSN